MENSKISSGASSIQISGIRKFYNKVAKVEGAISLTLGQPDFPVPGKVKEAMIRAIDDDKTVYTSNAGIEELREEISKYLRKFNINYEKDEICITAGGTEGIMDIFSTLLNKDDKVLVPDPAFPAYDSCTRLLGGEVITYGLYGSEFSIDFNELEDKIKNEKPKFMVLSYPSNPTGAVLSKEDNERLHQLIQDNDIIAVTDEMYSALCYEEEYYSISQYKDIKEKVIIVSGFSKTFSMTGLRIGYVCASSTFMDSILKVHQYTTTCAPSISQYGALEGLRNCDADVQYMKNEFKKRRDYVYKRLKDMGFEVSLPKGAFYIFPSVDGFGMTSEEFCEKLLNEAKVAIVPGSAFGEKGENFARISYAYSEVELEECMNRMEKWILKNR
ncbi:pyridoxal phosphate-dependent aminotransferase [Clostridium felsineum]|uniref:Aminotransferase n=1 Tax=Clostridium felsineum TaxID=36839 RepID=A0A1S8L0C3_9CLOT|nr:aminotransferase class I/II-fold pyridoxal phosphate-dependent enzyme [Clostridium felsineum]URZ07259.1 putative N-acetyl-LL-diaminopimelate aminotransferase [Clostridium felsineum]URZ12290.1 putative N-acetyl-LL-diaminopimelate aminotransferase [Clostridium felsineum]